MPIVLSRWRREGQRPSQTLALDDSQSKPLDAPQRARSPLLALPPELRNRIYEYVLYVVPTPDARNETSSVILSRPQPRWLDYEAEQESRHRRVPSVLSLFRVSRQVREEAEPLFYGTNAIEFHLYWNELPIYDSELGMTFGSPDPKDHKMPLFSLLSSLKPRRLSAVSNLTVSSNSITQLIRELEIHGPAMLGLKMVKLRLDYHCRDEAHERFVQVPTRLKAALLNIASLEDATVLVPPLPRRDQARRVRLDIWARMQHWKATFNSVQAGVEAWRAEKFGFLYAAREHYTCERCGTLHPKLGLWAVVDGMASPPRGLADSITESRVPIRVRSHGDGR